MKSATTGEKKEAAEGEGGSIRSSGGSGLYPSIGISTTVPLSSGYSTYGMFGESSSSAGSSSSQSDYYTCIGTSYSSDARQTEEALIAEAMQKSKEEHEAQSRAYYENYGHSTSATETQYAPIIIEDDSQTMVRGRVEIITEQEERHLEFASGNLGSSVNGGGGGGGIIGLCEASGGNDDGSGRESSGGSSGGNNGGGNVGDNGGNDDGDSSGKNGRRGGESNGGGSGGNNGGSGSSGNNGGSSGGNSGDGSGGNDGGNGNNGGRGGIGEMGGAVAARAIGAVVAVGAIGGDEDHPDSSQPTPQTLLENDNDGDGDDTGHIDISANDHGNSGRNESESCNAGGGNQDGGSSGGNDKSNRGGGGNGGNGGGGDRPPSRPPTPPKDDPGEKKKKKEDKDSKEAKKESKETSTQPSSNSHSDSDHEQNSTGRSLSSRALRFFQEEEEHNLAHNRVQYEAMRADFRERMEKPIVQDKELQDFIDELYRPGAKIGSGSTAAAIRNELCQ